MSHVARATQLRNAARQHDNAAPADCDDHAQQLYSEYRVDAAKIAEADEAWAGSLDGEQYGEIDAALANLHSIEPADLLGSDVLTTLYRLAKVCHAARDAELVKMANDAAERERREADDAHSEYLAERTA